MKLSAFARARWSVVLAFICGALAIRQYPGGTALNRTTSGYSLSQNFLSDLGMTVAYNGLGNSLGALFFIVSLLVLVIGLGGSVVEFVKLNSTTTSARNWSRAAAAAGLFSSLSFIGVAFTPENSAMSLHVNLTLFAFRVLPIAAICMGIATTRSGAFPRRVAVTWAATAVALMSYVAFLSFGPATDTLDGLRTSVIAQKVITVIVMSVLFYLSFDGDRVRKLMGKSA
ncbi:MAG: hypothetical protein ABJC26_11660 [Gemmatimonadaceae bacterium]